MCTNVPQSVARILHPRPRQGPFVCLLVPFVRWAPQRCEEIQHVRVLDERTFEGECMHLSLPSPSRALKRIVSFFFFRWNSCVDGQGRIAWERSVWKCERCLDTRYGLPTAFLVLVFSREFFFSDRMEQLNGAYWGLTCLDLMHALPEAGSKEREESVAFVWSCANATRDAFGGNVGHDAHLLYTLSAIQV